MGPLPTKEVAEAWVTGLIATMRGRVQGERSQVVVSAIKEVRRLPTSDNLRVQETLIRAPENELLHRVLVRAMSPAMLVYLGRDVTEGVNGLKVLQGIFLPMFGDSTGAVGAAIDDFHAMQVCGSALKLGDWLRQYEATVALMEAHDVGPNDATKLHIVRKCTMGIKSVGEAIRAVELAHRRDGTAMTSAEAIREVRVEAREAEARAARASTAPKRKAAMVADAGGVVIPKPKPKPKPKDAGQCKFWRRYGNCSKGAACWNSSDHTEEVRGGKEPAATMVMSGQGRRFYKGRRIKMFGEWGSLLWRRR